MQEPSAFPFTMMKGAKEFLALPPSSSLAPPLSKASIVAALDALDARMQEATKNTKEKLWPAEPPSQKSNDKTPSSSEPTEPTEPTSSSNQNNNNNSFNLSSYADSNAMATYVTDLLAAAKELTSNETNGQQQEDSPNNMNAQDHLAALSSALHDLLLMEQNKDDSKEDHQEEQQPQDDGQQAALSQQEQQTPQQQANDTLTNALSDLLLLQSPRHASSSITTTGRTTPTSTTSLVPVKRRKKLALRAATSVEKKNKKNTNKEKASTYDDDDKAKQDDRNTKSTSAASLYDSEETAAASHVHNSDLMTAIDQQHPEDEECSYYLAQDVEMVKTNTFESKDQQPSVVLAKEKAIVKASPAFSNRRFPSRRGHNKKKGTSFREPRWSAKKQPKQQQQQQQHVPTAAEAHPLHILQDDGFSVEMITGENEQEAASLILQHQKELDEQSLAVSSKKRSSSNKNNNITKSAEPPVDTMASEAADTSQHSSSFTENVVQNAASAAMTPEECIDPQGQEQLPDEPYNQETEAQVYTEEAEVDTEEAEVEKINDSSGERNDNQSVPPTSSSFPPVVDKMPSFSNGRQTPVLDVVVLPGSDSTDNSTLEYSASKSPRPSNTYQPLVMVEPKQKVMVEPKQKVMVEPKQKMRQRSSLPRRPSMLGSIRGDGGQSRNSSSSNSRRSETGPLPPKKNMRVLKMSIRRAGEEKLVESLNSKRTPFAEESAEDRNSQYVMVFEPQQQSSRKKKVGGGKQLRAEEDNSTKSSDSTNPSSQGSDQGSAASRRLVVLNRRRTRSRRGPFMRSVQPDGKLSGSSHHRLEILSVSPSTNNGNSESSSRRRVVQEKKRPGVTTLGKKDEGAVAVLSSTKSYEVFNVNNKTKKLSNCLVVFEPKNKKDVQEPKTYRDVYEPKTNKEDVYEPRTIKEDVYEPKTNKNVYGPMTNKEEAFESSPHINNGRSQRMRRMEYANDLSIGSSTTANATTGTRMSAESQQQNSSLMMIHPRTNKKSDTYILEEQGSDTSSGILEEDAMAFNGSMMDKETEAEEPSGHHASSIMGITSKRSELGSILSVVEEGEETVEEEADDEAVPETKNKRGARRTRQQLRKAQSEETDLDEALVAVISMEDLELVDNDDDEYGGGRPTTISDFIFTTVECFTCADEVEDDEVVDDFSRITPIGNHEFEEAMSRQPTLKGQPPASISDFMERRRRHRRNSLGSADDSRRFPFSVSSGISSLGFY